MFEEKLIVISQKEFKNKQEVISYLTQLDNMNVEDATQYQNDINERENIISTYVGFNIAIPHARTSSVIAPFVIYARLEQGVIWGEPDEIVKQVFMLGVPKVDGNENSNLHLKILSELSKRLMHKEFTQALLHAKNEKEIYHILKTIEEEMVV